MNNKIRNRLIGSITILLLIVIFFPYMVKDKSHQLELTIPIIDSDVLNQDIVIGEVGDIPGGVIDSDDETAIFTNTAVDEPISEPQVTIRDTVTNLPPTSGNNARVEEEKVYNIQLVALKNRQKIEELVALLRLHNYDVYTDPSVPKENQITRLLVGPYSSKEQAELTILDLKNLTKLNGFITSR